MAVMGETATTNEFRDALSWAPLTTVRESRSPYLSLTTTIPSEHRDGRESRISSFKVRMPYRRPAKAIISLELWRLRYSRSTLCASTYLADCWNRRCLRLSGCRRPRPGTGQPPAVKFPFVASLDRKRLGTRTLIKERKSPTEAFSIRRLEREPPLVFAADDGYGK
jgi:hypothetical protein